MNHHLYLFYLNNHRERPKWGFAKAPVPQPATAINTPLTDAEAAPILERIILSGREAGLGFICPFTRGTLFALGLSKLLEYFKKNNMYVIENNYATRSELVLFFTKDKLDKKFSEICPAYTSPFPRKDSCCIA